MVCCFTPKQLTTNWFYIFTIFRQKYTIFQMEALLPVHCTDRERGSCYKSNKYDLPLLGSYIVTHIKSALIFQRIHTVRQFNYFISSAVGDEIFDQFPLFDETLRHIKLCNSFISQIQGNPAQTCLTA